jgi:DNA polymerase type B, organellar and viral
MSIEDPLSSAHRSRRYRARHPGQDTRTDDRHSETYKRPPRPYKAGVLPFMGCDGEGSGTDRLGRQHFYNLRIGERELFTGQPLTTVECLEHICNAPRNAILVGFAFGYDTTMILRDLSPERLAHVLATKDMSQPGSKYTWWHDYGIEYLPKQYLKVCRIATDAKGKTRTVAGSGRTIWETVGFFQSSFLRALQSYDIGYQHWPMIEANKEARDDFDARTDEVRYYNKIECELLAELMEQFRENCHLANIRPRTWNGAGKLAKAMHADHHTIERKTLEGLIPDDVRQFCRKAYYGGRFEITRTGPVMGPIYEYDIRSAYPSAMNKLPCLEHGEWVPMKKYYKPKPGELYCAEVGFNHYEHGQESISRLCGLPVRDRHGHISWPIQASGIYWSPELESAKALGCKYSIRGGYRYVKHCDCSVFDWVNDVYRIRLALGKGARGLPLKFGINSLYGTLAQRIGNPRWGNFIWAGLITALTRAKLNDAIAQAPKDIIMVATDGIYSKVPLALPLSTDLGDWEAATHDRMFIVQPGLYWGPPKPKTRGIPFKFFEDKTELFEQAWRDYLEIARSATRPVALEAQTVSITIKQFIGLKLAQSRNKPETAGKWIKPKRVISFDWSRKRLGEVAWDGDAALTYPLPGGHDKVSMTYSQVKESDRDGWDQIKTENDEQPDYLDVGTPWKD